MTREIKIDNEQRRYVIPCGDSGWSCWGFDNCFDETYVLAQKLKRELPLESDIGTMKMYDYHRELIGHVAKNRIDLGTWFHRKTPPALQAVLEAARIDGMKVRVFYGYTDPDDPKYGKSWHEENDVHGRIGRSMGSLKVPLMITPGEDGGCALLDHCIVKIIGTGACVTLYEHPAFRESEFKLQRCNNVPGYSTEVLIDGEVHARFKKVSQADRWLKFMKGERIEP